jgi:hypothetical protein
MGKGLPMIWAALLILYAIEVSAGVGCGEISGLTIANKISINQ